MESLNQNSTSMSYSSRISENRDFDDIYVRYAESQKFYQTLLDFLNENSEFKTIKGAKSYNGVAGDYIIAMEDIHRFCVGNVPDLGKALEEESERLGVKENLYNKYNVMVKPYDNSGPVNFSRILPENFMTNKRLNSDNLSVYQFEPELEKSLKDSWNEYNNNLQQKIKKQIDGLSKEKFQHINKKKVAAVGIGLTSLTAVLFGMRHWRKNK